MRLRKDWLIRNIDTQRRPSPCWQLKGFSRWCIRGWRLGCPPGRRRRGWRALVRCLREGKRPIPPCVARQFSLWTWGQTTWHAARTLSTQSISLYHKHKHLPGFEPASPCTSLQIERRVLYPKLSEPYDIIYFKTCNFLPSVWCSEFRRFFIKFWFFADFMYL